MKKTISILLCMVFMTFPLIISTEAANVMTTVQKSKKKKSSRRKSSTKKKNETSADVKKQKQQTQKEIKLTKEQIEENEKQIKRNLTELSRLNDNITKSEKEIFSLNAQIKELDSQIEKLSTDIANNESRLEQLRSQYINAVKKMRIAQKKSSPLAFIFSAGSFYQAFRRMRYLGKFSEWRDRQSADIKKYLAEISIQKNQLTQSKAEKGEVLASHIQIKNTLQTEYAEQDKVIEKLKTNGEALKSHLAKKQTEANTLDNRIAQLIAAEEEKRRQEEAAAAEKARQEELVRQEAERKRLEQEALAKEEAKKKEDAKSADNKNNKSKKDNNKKEEQVKPSEKNYAEARGRNSRNQKKSSASTTATTFAAAKGSLPRPVAGSFRVERPFGKNQLPGLPDVVYDNPGIDAVVDPGSSALAVFDGTISAIYVLKEYSTVIIVSHGSHYTVYGNIASPAVKTGDKVTQGQSLGKLVSDKDDDNKTMIHFEVWEKRTKQNPMNWIK